MTATDAGSGTMQFIKMGGAVADIWDTIDDNNGLVDGLPSSLVTDWSSDTQCGGVEASASDANVWKDVTTINGSTASTCSGKPENCSYKDKISGLEWTKQPFGQMTWLEAVNYCIGLTYNGKTGWRLPTQKELMSAYDHGIRSVPANNFLTATHLFWSSSTVSNDSDNAWNSNLATGYTVNSEKRSLNYVVCVRP
jgi:hypothetical protein